jgi:hypothetical protein
MCRRMGNASFLLAGCDFLKALGHCRAVNVTLAPQPLRKLNPLVPAIRESPNDQWKERNGARFWIIPCGRETSFEGAQLIEPFENFHRA